LLDVNFAVDIFSIRVMENYLVLTFICNSAGPPEILLILEESAGELSKD
jgi:hypothetical protein